MRGAFLGGVALLGLAYTLLSLRLGLVGPAGSPGPGFVPRIVGVSMLLVLAPDAWTLVRRRDRSSADAAAGASPHVRVTLVVGALAVAMCALMQVVGTVPAAAAFLVACLSVLNPGAHRLNVAVGVGVPALLFLIFQVWLGVQLPSGVLGIP